MNENFHRGRHLDTKNYRSLAKRKQNKDTNNIYLKEVLMNNRVNEKNDIYCNEKRTTVNRKQSNERLLNRAQYYTEIIDYNNAMFDGKHFHFEKKWIKKKDYDDFFEKNRRICDISLKKLQFRNYRFGFSLFFLFFLLGIIIPALTVFKPLKDAWDKINKEQHPLKFLKDFTDWLEVDKKPYIYIIFFSVLMVILSVMIIIAFYKILSNNEKYKKIKLIMEKNE
ncbi:Plasmodium exported protein (Pm-fam-a like), unknown function [Plasmodium malariae]|uniref:Fam-m protein n=1 Tax=Plasmodium malariae TaxID=5858 RepID=A0A1A8X3Y6_PLAMA|nr:Plasmodium exported protein (Pm-fam-a like), unknown function [Plasmodium malariae]